MVKTVKIKMHNANHGNSHNESRLNMVTPTSVGLFLGHLVWPQEPSGRIIEPSGRIAIGPWQSLK